MVLFRFGFSVFVKHVPIVRWFLKWKEFNGQVDLHIGDTKTKNKANDEFNEILWKEYKFYVNVTVSIVYTELSYRSLCVISKVRLFFGFFAVVFFFQFLFCTFPTSISSIKITSLALGYYMFCFGDSIFFVIVSD